MSLFSKIRDRLPLSLKKLLPGQVRFPGRSLTFFDFKRATDDEMAEKVGDGTGSDVLMTPVRWLQRSIREAPPVAKDADGDPVDDAAIIALLDTPNPEYSWEVLLDGTVLSLSLDGNGYWIIARNEFGKPVELWYAPHSNIEPRWPDDNRDNVFISHYEYRVEGGGPENLLPEDVIHFREGIDLDNIRKGLSPLKGLLLEIFTDNEAAEFTAALLKNNGVPGLVISPSDPDVTLTDDEAKATKAKVSTELTGLGRGRPLVMTSATDVKQLGFSPKDLDLSPLRDMSEERVTAALGIPAAVVGFGSGLNATKVGATMRELRQLAWFNGVIPMQRIITGEINRQLLPSFKEARARKVAFDNQGVEALRENEDTKANRVGRLWRDGVITRAEARSAIQLESTPTDEVYLHNVVAFGLIPQGVAGPTGAEAPLEDPAANGNGASNGKAGAWVDYFMTPAGVIVHKQAGHRHDPTEERIIEAAPKAPPRPVAVRMATRLDGIRRRAPGHFLEPLADVFEGLGESAEAAALAVIDDVELVADPRQPELKRADLPPELIELAERIINGIDVRASQRFLAEAIERSFLAVAIEVSGAVSDIFGIAFELDDVGQRNVMRAGGLRAGLIDLDEQSRDAVFDALVSGRAEGLTGDNLARHIRDVVEAGPWRDAATRARIIARTEGAHAANVSTLEAARTMPETEHVQVFDDRTGFGDPQCVEANGTVITIDEAEAIGLAHPNCTRSFVPINSLLMEEMGL